MSRLKAPFRAHVNGGGVVTWVGTASNQPVYFQLEAIDPREGYGPWTPCGSLKWGIRSTDKSRCATNIYYAPDHLPVIRVGMGYKVGEVVVGQLSGLWDRVTAMSVVA